MIWPMLTQRAAISCQNRSAMCNPPRNKNRSWPLVAGICALIIVLVKPLPTPTRAQERIEREAELALIYSRIKQAVKDKEIVKTKELGSGNIPFKDVPARGAILSGFNVTYGDFAGNLIIKSIQPLFRTIDSNLAGSVHGYPSLVSKRVQAKKGYAVGAVTVKAGLGIDGFSVTFMKIENGSLSKKDSYTSEWLGGRGGGKETTLAGDGTLVVGIFGTVNNDRKLVKVQLRSLGLLTVP
jgi:hypothetical protein